MHKVFVYGTLKKGQSNHILMMQNSGSVIYLGQARTVNKYPLVVATKYKNPFLLDAPGVGKKVMGDVYEMTDELLKEADCKERHPNFYQRTKIRVKFLTDENDQTLEKKPEEEVWAYLLVNFKEDILAHDWLETFDAADHVVGSDVTQLDMNCNEKELEAFFHYMRSIVQK